MKKSPILNVPNILSLVRVILVPAFALSILLIKHDILGFIIPAVIYALTALTDMLDGKIARKYNLITNFGKFMDPIADKLLAYEPVSQYATAYRVAVGIKKNALPHVGKAKILKLDIRGFFDNIT